MKIKRHAGTDLLIGAEALNKLKKAHVLVVGLGGVGGYALEQLSRAGIGKFTIVDDDKVSESNINRQIIANYSVLGKSKADLFKDRIKDINPEAVIHIKKLFLSDDKSFHFINEHKYDYAVDAIDTLQPKVNLITKCLELNIPIVSSLGAGGKTDPQLVQITDISNTYNDGLARMLRKKLHKKGIRKGFKTVFSPEYIPRNVIIQDLSRNKKTMVGTISYMPAIFGIYSAYTVIDDIIKNKI